MSVPRTDEWPEIGELVVASVKTITHYGVYVSLDEFDKEGFLHVSEISSSWVKNIRNFVHESEKVTLKVLRVDIEKRHIDLSLRRVTKGERRKKMLQWKQHKKAESLMKTASQRSEIPLNDLYRKVWIPIEEAFGETYDGLEKAAREGDNVLLGIGIDEELAKTLTEIAKEKIRISMVKTKGTLVVSCPKTDGVVQIRRTLQKAQKVKVPGGGKMKIYVVSPPKYRIEVLAHTYKDANTAIKRAAEIAVNGIIEAGGNGVFERG